LLLLERACGEPVEEERIRAMLDTEESRAGRLRRFSGRPGNQPASSVDAVQVPHGRRESAGVQQERSVEVAKPHRRGRWRGTWLLSKFREQRGVFLARATTVGMTDPGCAWEGVSMNRDTSGGAVHGLGKRGTGVDIANHGCADEEPEPLAHKLPTSATTFALPATLRSLCDSGGGGA